MAKVTIRVPQGMTLIFRASKTLKDGRKVYASEFGLRGFPILVPRR